MRNLIIIFVFISLLFAQSSYEIMLSRSDITGLAGGTATDLDGIPTIGLAVGTIISVTHTDSVIYKCPIAYTWPYWEKFPFPSHWEFPVGGGSAFDSSWVDTISSVYVLRAGSGTEDSPVLIRPDDYAPGTNEKVWKQIMTSGTIEGFVRINDPGTFGVAETNFGAGAAETIITKGITWNTTLNRFDVLTSGIYQVTCYGIVELPNNANEDVVLRVKVNGIRKSETQTVTYVGFNVGIRSGSMLINWVGPVNVGQNISVTIDTRNGTNTGFWPSSSLVVRKLYSR